MGVIFTFLASVWVLSSVWYFNFYPSCLGLGVSFGGVFCVDSVSCWLGLLNGLILISLCYWFWGVSNFTRFMLGISLFSSFLCYGCVHAGWFWVFYEMSILPLLVLLAVDSPYSERYVALWYFLGYVLLGSAPMLLCLFYLSESFGSFDIRFWDWSGGSSFLWLIVLVLGVLFVTKIPLLPFHVWLPIVHAEASSPVSVCLSGYIMKLGLLGVYRFCWGFLPDVVFSSGYISVCLMSSLIFFFNALRELDAKRWLAFFSLGHISIAAACLSWGGWKICNFSFIYCLGHGLSAAAMFIFIWLMSDLSGSRNLLILKNGLWGTYSLRSSFCFVIGTVCCVPPTIQFFSELFLMFNTVWSSNYFLTFLLGLYIFFGGLAPVIFLGVMLSRQFEVHYSGRVVMNSLSSVNFLVIWSFILFLVC